MSGATSTEMKRWTRFLLIAAVVLAGFLAGGDLDRVVVAMPAWQHVGAIGWAAFSRNADLGNGLFLYPLEAIAGALLILGAIATFHVGQIRQRRTLLLLYAGLICSVGGLLFTIKAAPIMLGIADLSDPDALQRAFDGFLFWGNLRSVCHCRIHCPGLCAGYAPYC
jgi:hypothetical protein